MNECGKNELLFWLSAHEWRYEKVADLGSYRVHGNAEYVADVVRNVVGFDIVPGPGVDVVLEPGKIADEWREHFQIVVAIDSFQFCPDPAEFKAEVLGLLKPGGHLFLSMCSLACHQEHNTSPASLALGYKDKHRLQPGELWRLWQPELKVYTCRVFGTDRLILQGIKKEAKNEG